MNNFNRQLTYSPSEFISAKANLTLIVALTVSEGKIEQDILDYASKPGINSPVVNTDKSFSYCKTKILNTLRYFKELANNFYIEQLIVIAEAGHNGDLEIKFFEDTDEQKLFLLVKIKSSYSVKK